MLDNFYYLNNFGEKIFFGKDGVYASYNDLRDYQWSYDSVNNIITDFSRGIASKKLPVLFLSESGQKTRLARNKAFEIFEKDIIAKKKGKLYVNGYYMECWVIGTQNTEYLNSESYMRTQFGVITDKPVWVKTDTFSFKPVPDIVSDTDVEFDFDFPIDLQASVIATNSLINPNAFMSEFSLSIYGPCENPQIKVDDYTYSFNCLLSDGERLDVNSITRKIIKYDVYGNGENYFNCRNKENSVFKPIPSGNKQIQWNNEYSFDLTLIRQRSEPEWSFTLTSASNVENVELINNNYYFLDRKGNYIRDNLNSRISVKGR